MNPRSAATDERIMKFIATKQPLPQWLSMDDAKEHATAGASIWRWASTDEGIDPDVVMAAAGMVPTNEVLAAIDLLAEDIPDMRVRMVNVMDLMRLESRRSHPHALDSARGIREWWLADLPGPHHPSAVDAAIEQLAAERLLEPVVLPDGVTAWRAVPSGD